MKQTQLEQLKSAGFIFRKYEGGEEETFTINGEVLIVPTLEELMKAGVEYFDVNDKLDTKEEIADVWMAKNSSKKQEIALSVQESNLI